MAKNKTTETTASVADFIGTVADETKRNDSHQLVKLIEAQTGLPAKMWGANIIGFGSYHYQYESGHAGDAPLIGFSPRANSLVLYLFCSAGRKDGLLQALGKHKAGKGCLYVKKLADVDLNVLKEMILDAVEHLKSKYPAG